MLGLLRIIKLGKTHTHVYMHAPCVHATYMHIFIHTRMHVSSKHASTEAPDTINHYPLTLLPHPPQSSIPISKIQYPSPAYSPAFPGSPSCSLTDWIIRQMMSENHHRGFCWWWGRGGGQISGWQQLLMTYLMARVPLITSSCQIDKKKTFLYFTSFIILSSSIKPDPNTYHSTKNRQPSRVASITKNGVSVYEPNKTRSQPDDPWQSLHLMWPN